MKRIVGLVLAVAALGLVLVVRDRRAAVAVPEGVRQGGDEIDEAALATGDDAEIAAPGREEDAAESVALEKDTDRVALAPAPVGGTTVRVVRRDSGARVAGAEVASIARRGELAVLWDLDELESFLGRAFRTRTDVAGVAGCQAKGEDGLWVVARSEGFAGRAHFPRGTQPERRVVELVPDGELVVQVIDGAGAPLPDVELVLACGPPGAETRATSDPEGTARFPHVGLRRLESPGATWTVRPRAFAGAELVRSIPPEPWIPEPIVLQLPTAGALVVEVRGLDGEAIQEERAVWLYPASGAAADPGPLAFASTVQGEARFRSLPTGLELDVFVLGTDAAPPTVQRGLGPAFAGDEARVVVVVGADEAELLCRVVGEDGVPLGDRRVEIAYECRREGSRSSSGTRMTTDGQGRLRFTVPGEIDATEECSLQVFSGALVGDLIVTGPLQRGVNDVGDVVVAAPPVVLAGRVVDEAGAPVEGAHVRGRLEAGPRGAPRVVAPPLFGGLFAPSDADGRFTLRARVEDSEGARWVVGAERKRAAAEEVTALLGESDVVLVLRELGGIAGSLVVDAGIDPRSLEVWARADLESERGSDARLPVAEDGKFVARRLAPGPWTVRVCAGEEELVRIANVLVAPGEPTQDPRLQDIDLRGRLYGHRIVLEPPAASGLSAGADSLEGWLRYGASDAAGDGGAQLESLEQAFSGTTVGLVSTHPALDVELAADGYRRERVEGLRGERRVALRPCLSVRLVLAAGTPLPDPPYRLRARLEPLENGLEGPWSAGYPFDDGRAVRVLAADAGRLRVRWILERRVVSGGGSSTSRDYVSLGPDPIIELADTPAEQVIEVGFPAAELERAIAEREGPDANDE